MARYARYIPPGAPVHLISRFVNDEHRLEGTTERKAYLARVARVIAASDWIPLGYALMSTHVHWVFIAGAVACSAIVRPLHGGLAAWLNTYQARRGPVFADRPRTIIVPQEHLGRLLAYVHNNPVRAGVVADAKDSDWSSHRAYLGLATPPSWLNVELGLSLSGFGDSIEGRTAFRDYVGTRAPSGRDEDLTGAKLAAMRAAIRTSIGRSAEITSAEATAAEGLLVRVVSRGDASVLPRWEGELQDVLTHVADTLGRTTDQVLAAGRPREVARARRLTALAARRLGRGTTETAALLGVSVSSVSHMMRRASAADWEIAEAISVRMLGRPAVRGHRTVNL